MSDHRSDFRIEVAATLAKISGGMGILGEILACLTGDSGPGTRTWEVADAVAELDEAITAIEAAQSESLAPKTLCTQLPRLRQIRADLTGFDWSSDHKMKVIAGIDAFFRELREPKS